MIKSFLLSHYGIIVKNAVNQGDKGGTFSIGQSLRIRMGPLKGYLCSVLAVYRFDVTVKLDSVQKVLTGLLMAAYPWFCFGGRVNLCCNFPYVLFLLLSASIFPRFMERVLPFHSGMISCISKPF